MAEILGLDVSTVARGRRELLEHDVNVERVRKAGAGRKAVEKKRQKLYERVFAMERDGVEIKVEGAASLSGQVSSRCRTKTA